MKKTDNKSTDHANAADIKNNKNHVKTMIDVLFAGVFLAMIIVPAILINTETHLESQLENRAMTVWPGLGFNKEINAWYGHYVEDRVAFRQESIAFYNNAVFTLFHEFSEDLHMFGKSDYVFPADAEYIKAYQHLNTDENLLNQLTTYLDRTNQYLQQKSIPFTFMACLDKKTVYPEFFPNYIHVKTDNASIMERLSDKLIENKVPYSIPVDQFREMAKSNQIYNQKSDCAHWNDLGALAGIQLAEEELREQGLSVKPLLVSDFNLSYPTVEKLEFAGITINEKVPEYANVVSLESVENLTLIDQELPRIAGTSAQCFHNENATSDESILIFHDSFLQTRMKFFLYRYKNVYMVSRQNYEAIQFYVNLFEPDAVLFENAERAFVDDLFAYTQLGYIEYEIPYEKQGQTIVTNQSLPSVLTEVKGGIVENGVLQPDSLKGICEIKGQVHFDNEFSDQQGKPLEQESLDFYAKYQGVYYEAGYYPYLSGLEQVEGQFYAAFLTDQMQNGTIEFVAVHRETKEEYKILSLEVQCE